MGSKCVLPVLWISLYITLLYYDYCWSQIYCLCLQNENVFVEAALRELPTRTESEVKAHCAWYTEYCALLEAKRSAIQDWKKSREVCMYLQYPTLCILHVTNLVAYR